MLSKVFGEKVLVTELRLVLGTDAELNKYLGEDTFDGTIKGLCLFDDMNILLSVESGNVMKWLTHELMHFTYDVLKSKGIDHTSQTDEVYSYFYAYYFDEIYRRLKSKGLDIS